MLPDRISTYLLIGLLMAAIFPATPGGADSTSDVRLFWPPPPNAPRMEFVGVIESAVSLKVKWQEMVGDQAIRRDAERLNYPSAVTALADGRLLVTEAIGKTVRQVDFNSREIKDLLADRPPLQEPVDIATDSRGTIYVVDRKARKVSRYDSEMKPLEPLSGPITFRSPEKIAINESDRLIYVSDSILNRVLAFNLEGEFLFVFGNGENEYARLKEPHGLAIDKSGRLYVADTGNGRIQIYDQAGNFLQTFPLGRGTSDVGTPAPWDLTFDRNDNLHVIDRDRAAIIACRTDGRILYVTGASERTNHLLGFYSPVDIAIDNENRMYLSDNLNRRIAVWQLFSSGYLAANPIEEHDIQNLLSYKDYLSKHRGQSYFTKDDIKKRRETLQGAFVQVKPEKPEEIPLIVGQRVLACPMCNTPNRIFIVRDDIDLLLGHAAHADDLKTGEQTLLGQRTVLCNVCGSDIHVTVTFKEASGALSLATPQSPDPSKDDRQEDTLPARQTAPSNNYPPQAAIPALHTGQRDQGANL